MKISSPSSKTCWFLMSRHRNGQLYPRCTDPSSGIPRAIFAEYHEFHLPHRHEQAPAWKLLISFHKPSRSFSLPHLAAKISIEKLHVQSLPPT
ncbi:predicted protein [Botrytis cinerea T4]|uniref:Uncharacterized protein n=1 Tax=Botryotinia fuckeliana (strain T4) TaxID=999810 RepID=G2YZE6_BOTF4|nr:predicted protein [Botrytis cinerea T4]